MVWGFTLKGEAIFENPFTLYVKFAFNYFSQRKTSRKAGRADGGTEDRGAVPGKPTIQGSCGNRLVELRFSAG
ncbi:hypothetical protein, partial [Clostridium sp. MCC353]|uniref:hypothetical protein n=1 Tax=Clostridium sp. MCC353 TaxID=2592646 RepID=UPI001C01E1EC